MITWKDEYNTGIKMIDDQHRELFGLANELSRSIIHNTDIDRNFIIARLEIYSMYHFTTEEQYMMRCGYEDLENHKKEHEVFRKKIFSMKEHFLENESLEAAVQIHAFIEDWLLHHTTENDQNFVPCLKKLQDEFLHI